MVVFSMGVIGQKMGFWSQMLFFSSILYECILLIFILRVGLTLQVVGLDVELNSLSNGGIFKRDHWTKKWRGFWREGFTHTTSHSHPHPHPQDIGYRHDKTERKKENNNMIVESCKECSVTEQMIKIKNRN